MNAVNLYFNSGLLQWIIETEDGRMIFGGTVDEVIENYTFFKKNEEDLNV